MGHNDEKKTAYFLAAVEGDKADTGDLDDLEADTGEVADGVAGAAGAGNKDLVILVDKVEAAVTRDEARDLLAVLDELHAHALADGGVGLLGLDADLLEHDALCVRRATEGLLPLRAQIPLLEVHIVPSLLLPHVPQLPPRSQPPRLPHCSAAALRESSKYLCPLSRDMPANTSALRVDASNFKRQARSLFPPLLTLASDSERRVTYAFVVGKPSSRLFTHSLLLSLFPRAAHG